MFVFLLSAMCPSPPEKKEVEVVTEPEPEPEPTSSGSESEESEEEWEETEEERLERLAQEETLQLLRAQLETSRVRRALAEARLAKLNQFLAEREEKDKEKEKE